MKLNFSRCHAVKQKEEEKDLLNINITAVKCNNVHFLMNF